MFFLGHGLIVTSFTPIQIKIDHNCSLHIMLDNWVQCISWEKCVVVIHSYLPNGIGQDLDDLVLWCGHDTLPVYLYDAVPNADASPLCYATSHQTTDLQRDLKEIRVWREQRAQKWQLFNLKSDAQCHPPHWSQADTWDLASWWSPWWLADSEQCWASHIFGFSSPKKQNRRTQHIVTHVLFSVTLCDALKVNVSAKQIYCHYILWTTKSQIRIDG